MQYENSDILFQKRKRKIPVIIIPQFFQFTDNFFSLTYYLINMVSICNYFSEDGKGMKAIKFVYFLKHIFKIHTNSME